MYRIQFLKCYIFFFYHFISIYISFLLTHSITGYPVNSPTVQLASKVNRQDKIFSKKQFFLFATKFIRTSRKSLESQVFFKKSERLTWRVFTVLLSHNSLASTANFVHWRCLLRFIRLEIVINFVANKKNCFLLKILSRKPSFR